MLQHDSHARKDHRLAAFIQRHKAKLSHRDERMASAETKRARKNAKRCRDALRSEIGQRLSRERAFGQPFSSTGVVDAVIIASDDTAAMPSDEQFVSWALR